MTLTAAHARADHPVDPQALPSPLDPTPSSAATPGARRTRRTAAPAEPDRAFRPDIEGLRAIAVVLVVVYHAGLAFPGGYVGVDVFLVISGFLITRQLIRTTGTGGLGSLPTFYAHRLRRLLPAAAVVVVATVVAFRVWGPPLKVRDVALDGLFTTFYGLNYRLAALGTDYQHMGTEASPLQHFWSLAVEEQFYIVWPVVVGLCMVAGRSRRWLTTTLLVTVVLAAITTSAMASASLTATSAPWAYFSLHTRAWELGVGALLAIVATRLVRIPRRLAGVMAWAGIGGILWAAVSFTDATPFPGTAAWIPVGASALVIASGCGPRVGAERFLGEPLMQCLGRVSYSWYLWHWPLLVVAPYAVGHELRVLERCAVVWLSLVLALLSYLLVEQPVRIVRWPTRGWIGAGVAISGLVAASTVAVTVLGPVTTGTGRAVELQAGGSATTRPVSTIEAAVAAGLGTGAVPSNLTPAPQDAADSLPPTSANGCHAGFTQVEQGDCAYGDTTATRTVVLFGDSHAEQWLPALDRLGSEGGWRVVSWTKAACPAAELTVQNPSLNRAYAECDTWRADTVARIGALAPDLVLVSQSENVASSRVAPADFAAATVRTLDALRVATPASAVTYVQDIPTPGSDLPGCVAENLSDAGSCAYDLGDAYRYPDRHAALAPAVTGAGFATADPAPWLCTTDRCPAIVGNVLVYRNESHITVPYSQWLAPALAPLLTTKS